MLRCTLFLLLYVSTLLGTATLDLEENRQSFVLRSERLSIPGYPYAFNPGIIRWQGRLLLCFRNIPNPKKSFESQIGLIWLDDNFHPLSSPQMLNTTHPANKAPARAEDARLIAVGERLYLVYSDNQEEKVSRGGFRVYFAELKQHGEIFSIHDIECLTKYEGASREIREKNWVPFEYEGHLLLSYSLSPHRVFLPLKGGSGKCETFSCSEATIPWDWGILRGGTPALLHGKEYLAFFHSSLPMRSLHSEGKVMPHYFMGAYTFSQDPPFELTRMSPEPIIGPSFYKGATYKPYWAPNIVVFPGGYVEDDAFIWIVYGRQDRESWVVKLEKKGLFESLQKIDP